MRRTLGEWMFASLIALIGLIFLADYGLDWPASRTWPAALVLWGAFRAAAGLVAEGPQFDPEAVAPLPRRPSVFGPALLILAGIVLLVNNYYDRFPLTTFIADQWPWILVAWGGSWMLEDAVARIAYWRRPRPLGGGALVIALLLCLAGMGLHGAFSRDGFLTLLPFN